jgi:hypothetical protein
MRQVFGQIFGDRFYIEIMRHGMPEEDAINENLIRLARELNYPLVATNDSHYLVQGDAPAHDVLLCIGTGKTVQDTSRMKFFSDQFYVKNAAEMRELFADIPEACDNTLEIAKRIDITIPDKMFYLPDYPVPKTPAEDVAGVLALQPGVAGDPAADRDLPLSADAYLRLVCEQGLIARYGAERARTDVELRERLEYELSVIVSMGFSSYFLIVWDFIKYARDRDIPVGPGRGSAVGSLASYCLRITDLDPIKHKLIFERFLNPERVSMPDIDTDFCVERRDEVIRYVIDKYGKDRVAQIVTFGTMAARAAVRDAGRALGIPLPDVDRVAKLIPSGPTGLSIPAALQQIPALKRALRAGPADSPAARHREIDRRPRPSRLDPRGRDRDLEEPADRPRAADPHRRRRHQHAVRDGRRRAHRSAQDGFPRPAEPDRDEGGASDEIRRTVDSVVRPRDDPRRRQEDLRHARPRRDAGRVPAGVRRHEARQRRAEALAARGHHRARRALPPRSDGVDPAVHRRQARAIEADLRAPQARSDLGRHARDRDVPGIDHADRARSARASRWASRRIAQGRRQETERQDPGL